MNPPEDSKSSIVEHLWMKGAYTKELLSEVAEELDKREAKGDPSFSCFFQLPGEILLDEPLIQLKAKQKDIYAETKFFQRRVILDKFGHPRFEKCYHKDGGAKFTQVVMILPYWGVRKRFFSKYSDQIFDGRPTNEIIIPTQESWLTAGNKQGGRPMPMRVIDFENNLAWRSYRECYFAIGQFLMHYSLVTVKEFRCPKPLYNFFLMPTSGRITFSVTPRPILQAYLKGHEVSNKDIARKDYLVKRLRLGAPPASQFEIQILHLSDIVQTGQYRLVLIGVLSLLEWQLNDRYFPDSDRQKSLRILLKLPELLDIRNLFGELLFRASDMRNLSVHGSPDVKSALFVSMEDSEKLSKLPGMNSLEASKFLKELFSTCLKIYRMPKNK